MPTPPSIPADTADPVVVPYRDEYRDDFDRLNRAWIERHFRLEGEDEAMLGDPHATIVAPGGEVLFVVVNGAGGTSIVVGTCAVKPEGPPTADGRPARYELCKMAVDPAWQGRGYADLLVGVTPTVVSPTATPRLSRSPSEYGGERR